MNHHFENRSRGLLFAKIIKYLFPVVLAFVAVQYTYYSGKAIRERLRLIHDSEDVKLSIVGDSVKSDTVLWNLFTEKNWLETRFLVSKTDSINLSVDLRDSILQIELKGVVLKQTRIADIDEDSFFGKLGPGAYHHLFGTYSQIVSFDASIPKNQLTTKQAPKDTSSVVDSQPALIDTTRHELIYWTVQLDNGLVLEIEGRNWQQDDHLLSSGFLAKSRLNVFWYELGKTIQFKTPEYFPRIRLLVRDTDAKAILRALPENPHVCLRL